MNKDDVPILTISQSRVTIWLLLITGALFCTHLILQYVRWELGFQHYTPIIARFDLDQEASVPTWFSQFLFLFAGVLLFVISIEYKRMQSVLSKYWTFLGCLFLYFSIDDGAMLHEQLNEPARVV